MSKQPGNEQLTTSRAPSYRWAQLLAVGALLMILGGAGILNGGNALVGLLALAGLIVFIVGVAKWADRH